MSPRPQVADPLAALRHTPFRWLWCAKLSSAHAHWMDNLVRGWLVLELTGSVTQLALVAGAKSVPLLLVSLVAGVVADRMDRRRLVMLSEGVIGACHALLAVLLLTGSVSLLSIYVTAVAVGSPGRSKRPRRWPWCPRRCRARVCRTRLY